MCSCGMSTLLSDKQFSLVGLCTASGGQKKQSEHVCERVSCWEEEGSAQATATIKCSKWFKLRISKTPSRSFGK